MIKDVKSSVLSDLTSGDPADLFGPISQHYDRTFVQNWVY